MTEQNDQEQGSDESGLAKKNAELIQEIRTLKSKLRQTQEIKPEDYQAVVDELEAAKEKISNVEKSAKVALQEAEKFRGLYESESAHTAKNLIDSSLTNALMDAKVDPKFMKAVKALIGTDAKVVSEGDTKVAKIGEKPLGDYIKEWAATADAAHYISAPVNAGAGAEGGKSQPTNQPNVKAEEAKKTGDLGAFLNAKMAGGNK